MYLAKSHPFKETIEKHTDNLLKKYETLKNIYGDKIIVNWDLLKLACIYHDIGKVNRVFQKKIRDGKLDYNSPDIPHGYISVMFINRKRLQKEYDLSKRDLIVLFNVIAHHHKRKNFDADIKKTLEDQFNQLKEDARNFKYKLLPDLIEDMSIYPLRIIKGDGISGISNEDKNKYIVLKGLLNKIDYAASGHYEIEYPNDFLEDSLEDLKLKWGEDADFNELQKYMKDNSDKNIIAIAETGYGKTEAGLLWIGNNKGFFTLPLKSAINQIYERIRNKIVLDNLEERVGLLHSDTLSEYALRNNNKLDEQVLDYKEITNELSLPLTICTIDQIFDFVYKYVGFERKLATLSYSKVVIDEIQMYSSDLVAYIIIAIEAFSKMGGKFAILTATFPPFIKDLLEKRNVEFDMPEKPFLYNDRIRHSLKLEKEEINAEFIASKYQGNKVLVIVNTVKKLNELYEELAENYDLKNEINVFHSGFIKKDRVEKEKQIIEFGNCENNESGIWICTQVAEASLDIDFDLLITELSDLNGLFQRMGRCYRNRNLDKDFNIFVFDGGDGNCSGVGNVNDKDIFLKSKNILRQRKDGPIKESEKIELINEIYSTKSLKETEYYKKILSTINYIGAINYNEFKKRDVIEYFRNISSINVIPEPVYIENENEIKEYMKTLIESTDYLEKKRARIRLESFKVSIPYYVINHENIEELNINKYEDIKIYQCEYSQKYGIKHLKVNCKENQEYDKFF